jgi:hypothetical protein
MTAEQGGKGLLVTAAAEALEQFPISSGVERDNAKPTKVPQDGGGG